MKKAKKLTALVLLAAFVFAFIVPVTAMAENETGTITVDNPQKDQIYTAYKIFDVVYNSNKTAYSYTINGSSTDGNPWFNTVRAYANIQANGLILEKIEGTDTYNVNFDENKFSAPKFAEELKKAVSTNMGGRVLRADGNSVSVSGLPLGYYFVSSTSGALCNLTTTNNEVTIHDKNDIPFDKVDDKDSVEIGETVTYTITGKVPDTTGFETYTYEIADTMSNGLTFNKDSVVVKINDVLLSKPTTGATDADYTITYDVDGNANSFKVSIDVMKQSANVGKAITVTYTAKVNENAVATIEKNKATLTYSNDPTDGSKTTTTPPDEETVYSAKIVINKYAAGDETKKLSDAKFVLYREVTAEGQTNVVKEYYKYIPAKEADGADPKVEAAVTWVANKADATPQITDSNGAANFIGLKNGTYYLEEIEAPAGYNLLKEPVTITISGSDANVSTLTATAEVANSTGAELPSTGGMGTTIFYVLGAVLVVGAGVLLVTKKRMSNQR